MNILFARFSLLLAMIIAIAGTSMVQGVDSLAVDGREVMAACNPEPAMIGAAEPMTAQRAHPVGSRPAQRAVRWQSLLPGAFR